MSEVRTSVLVLCRVPKYCSKYIYILLTSCIPHFINMQFINNLLSCKYMTVLTLRTFLCAYFIVCSFFLLICVHYCINVVAVVVEINSIHKVTNASTVRDM